MDSFSQLSFVKQIEPLTGKKWCLDPIQSSMTITLQSGYGGIHVPPSGWVAANGGTLESLRRHTHQQQRSNLLTNLRASAADIHGNLGVMTCDQTFSVVPALHCCSLVL